MELNLTDLDLSIRPAGAVIRLGVALAAVVIGYAFVLGLNPVQADDTFFLLNDARWVIQHHEISWTEHFSSAQGERWVYPLGAGLLFYAAWLIGGFAALFYIGAAATATTTALLLRKDSISSVVLAVLAAVPISYRTGTNARRHVHSSAQRRFLEDRMGLPRNRTRTAVDVAAHPLRF